MTRQPAFRVAFVPGVSLDKWARTWERRVPDVPLELVPVTDLDQLAVLYDGRADMSFVRLPVDRDEISLIPLYTEVPVVVVPEDHPVTAFDEVSLADLAGEHLLQHPDSPTSAPREAVAAVANGEGIVILPMSVARHYHRKDVTYRPVTGMAGSQVGLAWLTAATDSRTDTFVGIVRGRTERSSRGARP